MAPSKTSTIKNPKARKSATAGGPTSKSKSKVTKRPPSKQVKTKPGSHSNTAQPSKPSKRKKKIYSDKDLNLPALNMITPHTAPENPTNLAKRGGAGKKKDKIYIDDVAGMKTILAMVTAEKEGQIESKLMRARQLEEVREARREEMERRKEGRREELEGVKREVKRAGKKGKERGKDGGGGGEERTGKEKEGKNRKRVSFA